MLTFPDKAQNTSIYNAASAAAPLVLAELSQTHNQLVFVALDDARLAEIEAGLGFVLPAAEILQLPAWDCLPYDRAPPNAALVSQRLACFTALAEAKTPAEGPRILLTTVNSWMQRTPPKSYFRDASLSLRVGDQTSPARIAEFLEANGFLRSGTVREYGEYAIRGGIMDIFAEAGQLPARLDFFGDELEKIRLFDSLSQRSLEEAKQLVLRPAAEFRLDDAVIASFRTRYLELFGGGAARDPVYEAVSAGQIPAGLEHYLPLLHDQLALPEEWLEGWPVILDNDALPALTQRSARIAEFFAERQSVAEADQPWRPVPQELAFRSPQEIENLARQPGVIQLHNFDQPAASQQGVLDLGCSVSPVFAGEQGAGASPSQAAAAEITRQLPQTRVLLTAASKGAVEKLADLVGAHLPQPVHQITDFAAARPGQVAACLWPLRSGFSLPGLLVLSEQDIFGARIARATSRRRRAEDFLREVSSLEAGELVVHIEHGIGRYEGLETIQSGGADHDCLRLVYADGDRLFLPVENIDLLSRYGRESAEAVLDRLGGVGWQARKARIKGRIREMADQLMQIAARRTLASSEKLVVPAGSYDEFCARFGFQETEDQLEAIEAVLSDLASGQPADRLICGDVGFGKTEVALRAAFVAVMAGYQVALVTPTTLLARQHGRVFTERFSGFGIETGILSRMTSPAKARQLKKDLASGSCQLVIGTHALLSKSISFNNLGLLIIDEEQHFGVAQKERLKSLRGAVHVLTLSATPIPRTLQMALSGVRQMSLITTPPADRLAVRTFVGPWDRLVLKEAIKREKFRGGQIFVVCPRIRDLDGVQEKLVQLVPDARILIAHGRLPAAELDQVMTDFATGKADILLSTNIIESGIDIPTANTLIVWRSDQFGLSQLYQLRGRVGRSRNRAYAYLTTEPDRLITQTARRRLEVMQTLDQLGAGFSLASYDMDIRGAGNLLGEEQSGHVREVGVELYQDMLRQAVALARSGKQEGEGADPQDFAPQLNLGLPVLIPADYIEDLTVRLAIYRRIAGLADEEARAALEVELIDRFGPLPEPLVNLLAVVELKNLCRLANIERVEVGNKGVAFSFRKNHFARPDSLVGWIARQPGSLQMKPDHRLVMRADFSRPAQRPDQLRPVLAQLADMASQPLPENR